MLTGAWLVFAFAWSSLFAQLLQIRAYGTNDGLPQSEIISIYQDRTGYLWFGTYENGLARYDGRTFQRISFPDNILNGAIRSIYQDRHGAMWIGTEEGLVRLVYNPQQNDTTVNVYTTNNGLPHNFITSFLEDSSGTLWIGTRGGACYWRDSGFAKKLTARGDRNNYVLSMTLARDGTIWMGTAEGVNVWRDDSVRILTTKNGLADNQVRAVLCDRDGVMWLGTKSGLTRINQDEVRTFNEKNGLYDLDIRDLVQDQHGKIWLGAISGLASIEPAVLNETMAVVSNASRAANGSAATKIFSHFDSHNGLSSDRIATLFVDYENNLWIGTWGGGVCKLFGTYLENYVTRNGLPAAPVYSFLEDRQGRIWIGTNGGGVAVVDGHDVMVRDANSGLPNNVVHGLAIEPSGAIWIGTEGGAVRIPSEKLFNDPSRWQIFTRANGLPDERINDIYCSPHGEVWLATALGGAVCYKDGNFTALTKEQGLPGNTVGTIFQDSEERLWIATIEGLVLRQGDEQKVFRRGSPLPAEDIYDILEDHAGNLWFGTRRGGAVRYANGQFAFLNAAHGLSNDVVYFINEDRQNRLWFGTNAGVDGFAAAALNEFLDRQIAESNNGHQQADSSQKITPYFHLSSVHGLADNESNAHATWRDRQGRLWFGTASGATKLYPERLPLNLPAPRVHIESIEVDGQVHTVHENLRLKANHSIVFHFCTLSFINEKHTRSQYYLEGFDKAWLDFVDEEQARYTNLAPKKYTFHLRGVNALGISSNAATQLHFEVLPPFYRRAWFIIGSLILIIGLIYGGHRWRLQHVNKRNLELEKVIEEKTHGLKETHDFLANIKESLPVGLLVIDNKRFVVEANQTAAELFGYRLDDLHDQEIHNLLAGETMTRDMLWAALREEKRATPSSNGHLEHVTNQSGLDIEGLRRDGKKFPCRVHACNVEDERSALRYVILTCEDMSERRQLEQNLLENQKQLALLDLLAGMGDILNNKLTGIQGYLDLLKNALTMGVARREDSGQITPVNPVEVIGWAHSSASEMNTILRQLIEFGTYIAKVQAAPLDLRDILHALERRWNKTLKLKLPEMTAPLWVNAVPKIKAGLDEAIRNSREAEATEVVMTLEKLEELSRVRLTLTDNGRGISPDLVSKVFLPFFKTKTMAHPGLGLWKLRQLVQQSGGSVEINFVPKGGTQLVVILPRAGNGSHAEPTAER